MIRRPLRLGARTDGTCHDRGSVTAEFAVVLPAVVATVAIAAMALGACARQVRLQDAAADAARLVARGESTQRARGVVAAAASGAAASISFHDDLVCVDATADAGLPVPLPPLAARSCALAGGL